MIIIDEKQPFGDMSISGYDNELLHLAHDLGSRLLQAFVNTTTDLPYPRVDYILLDYFKDLILFFLKVNLKYGVPQNTFNHTCTSGAGSLLLEFGLLSRLIDDPIYETVARKAIDVLYDKRDNFTGLFGNEINIQTGEWLGVFCGLGAGLDSYYEYLLKVRLVNFFMFKLYFFFYFCLNRVIFYLVKIEIIKCSLMFMKV